MTSSREITRRHTKRLTTGCTEGFTVTPFAHLQEGDEFVRINLRPVLLKHITGTREGNWFTPTKFGAGRRLAVRRMVRRPHGLDEQDLTRGEPTTLDRLLAEEEDGEGEG